MWELSIERKERWLLVFIVPKKSINCTITGYFDFSDTATTTQAISVVICYLLMRGMWELLYAFIIMAPHSSHIFITVLSIPPI